MSLKLKTRRGGAVFVGAVFAILAVTAFTFSQIRFGGPIQQANQRYSDLVADILPPPLYAIEPFLEATMAFRNPATLPIRKARLAALEQQYRDRTRYWDGAGIDSEQTAGELQTVKATADGVWHEIDTALLPALQRRDATGAQASYNRLETAYATHRKAVDTLVVNTAREQAALAEHSQTMIAIAIAVLALLGAGLLTGCFFGLRFIDRAIVAPIQQAAQTMRRMAGGDLDVAVTGIGRDDEIGMMAEATEVFREAFRARIDSEAQQRVVVEELGTALEQLAAGNLVHRIHAPLAPEYEALRDAYHRSIDQLEATLARVVRSATDINGSADEIRSASDDLARRTEGQAARLEETAGALNEVTGIVVQTASDASQARSGIEAAHAEMCDGGIVVGRAVSTMGEIAASARTIGSIVEVIDGIAFQTNLLALNAGVEAARAGDAGKGFAVVANEVRALAGRCSEAASEIRGLISTSARQVGDGVELVNATGTLLERLTGQVGAIAALVGGITGAAGDQADRLRQVNLSVQEMDRMTQQNAAMVEEATAAARGLSNEAGTLHGMVGRFQIKEAGGRGAALRRVA